MSKSDQEELLRRAMFLAPIDDEADRDDDEDGGLTEARKELARGEGVTTEELERELDRPPGIE